MNHTTRKFAARSFSPYKYFLLRNFLASKNPKAPWMVFTTVNCSYNGGGDTYLGRCGHKSGHGPNMGRFRPSCVHLVYFLRKSTEFHVKRTECQRILLHLLLLIFS